MNKKELKKISKEYICGPFMGNREFGENFKRITGKLPAWNRLNKIKYIIDEEIDDGIITTKDEILERRFELIYELYGEKEQNYCVPSKKQNDLELHKDKYLIELPYTSSGMMLGYASGAFGGIVGAGSRMGEGRTEWRTHKCYVMDNGLSIEESGDFIQFNKIKSVNKGKEEGILIKHINITLELRNDKTFSFRISPRDISLLDIIEDNMIFEDNITIKNNNNLDELLKAKELLESGLLTSEEFNKIKEKILNIN